MPKVSVTWKTNPGDAKVCEGWGYTFFDGKAEDIEVDDATLDTIKQNRQFTVAGEKHKDK